jgi:hypothetical protein
MCQCSPSEPQTRRPLPQSVHAHSVAEAMKFKWIESERAGRDLGESAILAWIRQHWNGYLRRCWLEHLQGVGFWVELDHDDFGLLQHQFRDSELIDEIVWKLKNGWENLDIICWALDERIDADEVYEILLALDINGRRLDCQLRAKMAQAG